MKSEQREEILLITQDCQDIINELTAYSQNYTLTAAAWFRYCYFMGASAGLRAVLLNAPGNETLKTLNTANAILLFAYENGYAMGRTIANYICADGGMTEAEAMQKLNAHCKEMFCSRYPEEFWAK